MAGEQPMEVKAVKLPAIRRYLERENLLDEVLPIVPEASRALLEKPPLTTTWVPTAHITDVYEAVRKLRGPGAARQLAYETSISAYGPLLKSLVSSLFSLVGASPATLLTRAETFTKMFERGTTYEWTSTGERAGFMTIRTTEPVGPASCEAFESLAMVAMVFAKAQGKTRSELRPGNQTVIVTVEW